MPVKLNGATSGSVQLDVPAAIGSDLQLTLPATAGDVVVKAADGSVDLGSVDIDSSGNVGIGVTPNTHNIGKALEIGAEGNVLWGEGAGNIHLLSNAYYNGGYKYATSAPAGRYNIYQNTHTWARASSGTADAAATFTESMRIDSSGKVGIGTTSPANRLTVIDRTTPIALKIGENDNATTEAGLEIQARNTANTSAYSLQIAVDADAPAATFDFAGSERLRIDSSGNVGIGTNAPDYSLTIGDGNSYVIQNLKAATNEFCEFRFGDTDSVAQGKLTYDNGTDSLRVTVNASERMRIDSAGRVGIGTSNPTNLFTVSSAADTDILFTTTNSTAHNRINFTNTGSSATGGLWYGSSNTMEFRTANTERMRISSDGYKRLHSVTSGMIVGSLTSAGTTHFLFKGAHSQAGITTGATDSFVVYTNGNVVNTNNSYGSLSDAKLKENIVDANSQWDDIKGLRVRNYNFIEGQTHTQIGVVAQEVEPLSPGLVNESPDVDAEGKDLGTVTKSVKYSVLYMKAVKALQEAMERIETLETKVASLEANS